MAVVKQKIVPHLWFDREAKEAAHFYCTVFPDSSITSINTLHKTPSGDCDVVSFTLSGQPFMAISADLYSSSMSPFPSWSIARPKKK